jgi:hypothetical protein
MLTRHNIKWIQGDGGPTVVLQASAAARWQGAALFDDSLMSGGSVETDYDAICRCEDGVTVIERYGWDMLVLSDSEWATCFVPSKTAAPPSESIRFAVRDSVLRLLVGGDDGDGTMYGFLETQVVPGNKVCEVYYSDEAQVVVLRAAEPAPAPDC